MHLLLVNACFSFLGCGPSSDLGVVGRSRVVADGVVNVMRALEVAVYMNNSSMKEVVRSDALTRERSEMAKKMVEMEA